MRFFLLIALALFCATPAAALVVNQDMVWDGPHSFNEDVQVLPGATLTITPGSQLHFSGTRLEISGHFSGTPIGIIQVLEYFSGISSSFIQTSSGIESV